MIEDTTISHKNERVIDDNLLITWDVSRSIRGVSNGFELKIDLKYPGTSDEDNNRIFRNSVDGRIIKAVLGTILIEGKERASLCTIYLQDEIEMVYLEADEYGINCHPGEIDFSFRGYDGTTYEAPCTTYTFMNTESKTYMLYVNDIEAEPVLATGKYPNEKFIYPNGWREYTLKDNHVLKLVSYL